MSTFVSKGLATKSSPPMFIAMIMFILSLAEEMNMTGTELTLRISAHQWYPLMYGRDTSISTRCGCTRANSAITARKSAAHTQSSAQSFICAQMASARLRSSSTRKMRCSISRSPFVFGSTIPAPSGACQPAWPAAAIEKETAAPTAPRSPVLPHEKAREKFARFRVLRIFKNVLWPALLTDDAVGHKDDVCGNVARKRHLVRYDDHRKTVSGE